MNDFRFTLISILIFIIIIGLGTLAFFSLEPGDRNGARQRISDLEAQLASKDEELQVALRRLAALEADSEQVTQQIPAETENEATTTTSGSSSSQPELLTALEKLKASGVILGPGDQGPNVGTIQKFLNVYENKSGGVDNDFGPGTRERVEAFQKAEGISVDGGVGPGTLTTMIEWLETN